MLLYRDFVYFAIFLPLPSCPKATEIVGNATRSGIINERHTQEWWVKWKFHCLPLSEECEWRSGTDGCAQTSALHKDSNKTGCPTPVAFKRSSVHRWIASRPSWKFVGILCCKNYVYWLSTSCPPSTIEWCSNGTEWNERQLAMRKILSYYKHNLSSLEEQIKQQTNSQTNYW